MICIIQARMSSKRLPGKMLKNILNKTLLERVVNQVKKSKHVQRIIIATSNQKSDDKLVKFCKKKKYEFFRGDLKNVALRFMALLFKIKSKNRYFVRISGDSPMLDYKLIDYMYKFTRNQKFDLISNVLKRSFPKGQSIEIVKISTFKKNISNIFKKNEKEHVTSYFYNNKDKFRIKSIESKKNFANLNFCIDNNNDIKKIINILKHFKNKVPNLKKLISAYNNINI